MFSKWTYKLLIKNTLDRPLVLKALDIPYGTKKKATEVIPPNGDGECTVFSSAGKPTGIEFYVTYADKCENSPYGSFTISIDIPFWKSKNTSKCSTTGIIKVEGFQNVPNGNHDFQNSIIVTTNI